MFKIIYLLIFISFFSCNKNGNRKKSDITETNNVHKNVALVQDSQFNKKEKIVKAFFDLFDEEFVSIKAFENVFGSHLVEEEYFFYQNCEKENNVKYCNEVFDNCIENPSKCKSNLFHEVKKSEVLKKVSFVQNRVSIFKNLKKIDEYNYQSNFKDINCKFNFSYDEREKKLIINRFSVNGTSIFEILW